MEYEHATLGASYFFHVDAQAHLCDKPFLDLRQVGLICVGADDSTRLFVGNAEHDHTATLVREGYGILDKRIEIERGFGFLEFDMLVFIFKNQSGEILGFHD